MFKLSGRYLVEWKNSYSNAQEMMQRYIPEELDSYVVIKSYVGTNHAVKMANRSLHSRITIFVNNAPVIWYIKHQNTIKDSSFGSFFLPL